MQNNIRDRFEKTRAQLKTWSNETLEELQARQKELTQEFQSRQHELSQKREDVLRQGSEVFDQGLGAVLGAEATVLETARSLLSKARTGLGGRRIIIKRGEDALSEALVALRAGHRATLPIENYDDLSIKAIKLQLDGLDWNDLRTLRAYETRAKGRKTLLKELDKRIGLAQPFTSPAESAEA